MRHSQRGPSQVTYDPRAHGAACDSCPGRQKKPVAPNVVAETALVVVGETPSRLDERDGTHFSGPVGGLLFTAIRDAHGPARTRIHLTTAALCRLEDEDEQKRAAECCAPRLHAELSATSSETTIMTCGALAAKSVLNASGILKVRGFVWRAPAIDETRVTALERAAARLEKGEAPASAVAEAKLKAATLRGRAALAGRRVHPTLTPGFVLNADLWKAIFDIDVRRAVSPLPETLDSDVTGYHAGGVEVLAHVTGNEVALDIETDGKALQVARVTSVSVSDGENTAVVYPWEDVYADALSLFLCGKTVIMQNGYNFDQLVLGYRGVTFENVILEDTMLHHHAYYSHWPHNLGHIVTELCVSEPWKILAKGAEDEKGTAPSKMTGEQLCKYNAQDGKLTLLRWKRRVQDESGERTYAFDKRLGAVCGKMIHRGMPVDLVRLTEIKTALEDSLDGYTHALRRVCKWDAFDSAKWQDVGKVIYEHFNVQVTKTTPTGQPATDKAVIEVLSNQGGELGEFCRLLIRKRLAAKILSTYVLPERVVIERRIAAGKAPGKKQIGVPYSDITGCAHYNWRQLTVTGRLNTRIQSAPKYAPVNRKTKEAFPEGRVREFYTCEAGESLVYFDASQIQMRIAAYLSGDEAFMKACEGDVHANNAAILFPEKAALGWFSEDNNCASCVQKISKVCTCQKKNVLTGKPFRDITKNTGFAVTFVAEDKTVWAYLVAHGFPVELPFVVRAMSNLRSKYRHYFRWVTANWEQVKKCGYLRSPILGRIMWLGWTPKITEVAADIIQAGEADIISSRMVEVEEKHGDWMKLIGQFHDACMYRVKTARVQEAKDILTEQYARPIPEMRNLVLPIDLKSGQRWSDFG